MPAGDRPEEGAKVRISIDEAVLNVALDLARTCRVAVEAHADDDLEQGLLRCVKLCIGQCVCHALRVGPLRLPMGDACSP